MARIDFKVALRMTLTIAISVVPMLAAAGGATVYESHSARPYDSGRGSSSVRPAQPSQVRPERHDSRVIEVPNSRYRPPHYEVYRAPAHHYYRPATPFRYYRGVPIYRPYGPHYSGYGFYYSDHDAFRWLAFTALTVALINQLNEPQLRRHEDAQVRATTAPIGERITWREDDAEGTVTAVREGDSENGRYCREFKHTLMVGRSEEDTYGTACQNADGSWELID